MKSRRKNLAATRRISTMKPLELLKFVKLFSNDDLDKLLNAINEIKKSKVDNLITCKKRQIEALQSEIEDIQKS